MANEAEHVRAYVRHRAKASAYATVGNDRRAKFHKKRAVEHMQHFGDDGVSDYHTYGHPVWPEPKGPTGPTMADVKDAIRTTVKGAGFVGTAALAAGMGLSLPAAVVTAAGVCLNCKDIYNEYTRKSSAREPSTKRP
jgi:hypothetical protein